jgi:hypothetical protein
LRSSRIVKKREMVPLSLFVKYDPFCFNFFNSQN